VAGLSPTMGQRRLARTLRQLRIDAGLTIDQAAERLELSPSTISRMETAHVGIKRRDVRELLDLYNITGPQRDQLLQLAGESRRQAWWHEYKDLPNAPVAALEDGAASISQYSALLVPGLLQTEAYGRAVLQAIRPDRRARDLERRLRLRMTRQALLTGETAPQYWVILDEAALRRTVGGSKVMPEQLDRLIDATELPNVTIQVLPFSNGAHAGMDGEFTILHYRDSADPDMLYIENTGGDVYFDDPEVTHRYVAIFDHLRAAALDPAESYRTLAIIKDELLQPERT
jgi:transcriptional regulator with XRE-family HTH domain